MWRGVLYRMLFEGDVELEREMDKKICFGMLEGMNCYSVLVD
jgi:hypothetical protein